MCEAGKTLNLPSSDQLSLSQLCQQLFTVRMRLGLLDGLELRSSDIINALRL